MEQHLAHLIERSADLKSQLIKYAQSAAMKKEFDPKRRAFDRERTEDKSETIAFLDDFIMLHRCKDGRRFLEHFVAERPELPDDEKTMLLGWQNAIISVFEVEQLEEDALIGVSLVDDLTYRIYSNMGREFLRQVREGSFLYGRVAPIGGDWLISGVCTPISARDKQRAYDAAYQLSMQFPALVFRNPEKREQGFAMQREDYRQFVAFFGTDSIAIPTELFESQMRAYMRYKMTEARGEDGLTVQERLAAEGETLPDPPEMTPPEWVDEVESIGVLCDEREGMYFVPDYAMLEAAFDYPELVKKEPYASLVQDYFESPDLHPMALRRLATRDYDRATQVVRLLFRRPRFSWERDAETFLQKYKSGYEDDISNPGVTPISDKLSQALRQSAKAKPAVPPPALGRNAPCPCGSGQKYKKCCGK